MNYSLKILVLFLILFNNTEKSFAQVELLLEKYNSQKATARIQTGLEICDSLASNPEELLKFARQLNGETKKSFPNSLLYARTLRAMSDAWYYNGNIDSSSIYLNKAINIYELSGEIDTLFIGSACNDLGFNHQEQGKRNESRIYLQKAIDILSGTSYTSSLADAKSNLAFLYHAEGKFEEAIELFREVHALDLADGNAFKQSSSLNSLGRMHIDWGKYETGLEYYLRSVELLDSVKDIQTLAIRYNNIGMVHQLMGNHKEAISWIEKAKKIDEQSGNRQRLATRYFNLANSYTALKQFAEAEGFFLKAKEIFTQIGQHSQLSKLNAALGQMYFSQGRNTKALQHFLVAEQHAELNKALPEKSAVYNRLYSYYKETGLFDKALQYYERYIDTKDSIYNLDAAKQIEELEVQYQTAQKELEINRLETENELSRTEVQFRKRERNIATLGFFILAVLLAVLYKLFTIVKKQKSILSTQNAELERLNSIQNQLFSIISHDFRSITSSYQASAKIIEYHLNKGHPEKLIPIAGEISQNSKNLSSMLENLLQWAVIRRKGLEPEKKLIPVREEFNIAIEMLEDQIRAKNNTVEIIAGEETVYCDPESLRIVLRNLMANANKFTSSGLIRIEAASDDLETVIRISDSGKGMTEEVRINLFKMGKAKPQTGTAGEKGTGLGLLLVAEHLEINSGRIEVISEPGKGTTFIINLPKSKK